VVLCQGPPDRDINVKKLFKILIAAFALTFIVSSANATIKPPKGHYKKAYDATFLLYGSSKSDQVENHAMCSATAFRKVKGGYLLLSAGHCTKEGTPNEFPTDLTYSVSSDIGTPIYPVKFVTFAFDESKNLDFSVFFFQTTLKFPVIELGDERTEEIGAATYNFNFSKAVVKMLAKGVVVSSLVPEGEPKNLLLVDMFAASGSSGSAVISEKTHKIIGIVSYGWETRTMPEGVVPISVVRLELSKSDVLSRLPSRDIPLPCPKGRVCINELPK
jgi:hypothetical protein